jgi:uncharacterized protein (DUF2235 family)
MNVAASSTGSGIAFNPGSASTSIAAPLALSANSLSFPAFDVAAYNVMDRDMTQILLDSLRRTDSISHYFKSKQQKRAEKPMSDASNIADQPDTPEQNKAGEEPTTITVKTSPDGAKTAAVTVRPKSKNIIVCCDGTGNEFIGLDTSDPDSSNSNVVRLYTALKLDNSQIAYYHPGVGTMGEPSTSGWKRQWSVAKGLAFGKGFEENVLDAYRYLMQHYNSGDKVYLFGFSRGSYTARALAGLLHGYGLLCRGNEGHIPYAWRMYTDNLSVRRAHNARQMKTDYSFRDTFSHRDFMIRFVGLWDTVSSVGWISEPLRLLHLAQNSSMITVRHAVSADERRCFYQDNLYGDPVKVQTPEALQSTPEAAHIPEWQDLVQVWFPGVHSDVGGSYSQPTSGLSTKSLEWMIEQAEASDLVFDPVRRKIVLGETLTPKEEEQPGAADLASLYPPPVMPGVPHVSLTWKWWPLEIFPHRYYVDDNAPERMRIPLGARRRIRKGTIIAASLWQRLSEADRRHFTQPVVPPGHGTIADLSTCHQATSEITDNGWRENPFVVLLVTVFEIAIGLLLGWYLLLFLLHILSALLRVAKAFVHRILPADHYHPLCFAKAASCVRDFCHAASHGLIHWWSAPLAAALLIVALHSLVAAWRNRKQQNAK